MIEDVLEQLGLSQRESKVYTALLSLGETTVGPIAHKTKIATPKIYPTLDKLQEKGLISYIIKSKTKYFQALEPKNLLRALKEKEEAFNQILPELESLHLNHVDATTAEIFEGYASMKALFNDILNDIKKTKHYYVFAYKEQYQTTDAAKNFLKHFHADLAEKGINDCLIAHESVKKQVRKNFSENKNIKLKFTPLNIPLGLIITSNYIVISNWDKKPINIRINSKTIAKQYEDFFKSIWNL